MEKIGAWLVTLVGVLLALPLVGVTALGDINSGIAAWLIALAFIIMGVSKLMKK